MIKIPLLNAYWIKSPSTGGFGFGVTAYSREEAFQLLGEAGHAFLAADPEVEVIEGIKSSDLDQTHVVPNMGPLLFRGVWYPCTNL